jgi:hypothetical protein
MYAARATHTLFQRAWVQAPIRPSTSWYTVATCHVDLISDAREPIAARRERVSACHVERRCIRCQRFAIIHRVKGPRQHRRSALLGQIHHTRLYRSHSPRAVSSRGNVPHRDQADILGTWWSAYAFPTAERFPLALRHVYPIPMSDVESYMCSHVLPIRHPAERCPC